MINFIIISLTSFMAVSLVALFSFRRVQRNTASTFSVFFSAAFGGTMGALPLFLFPGSQFYLLHDPAALLLLSSILLVVPGLFLLRQNRIEGSFLPNLFLQIMCYLPLYAYIFVVTLADAPPLTSPALIALSFIFFLFILNSLELFEALGPFNNLLPMVLLFLLSLMTSFPLVLSVPLGIFSALFILDLTAIKIKGVTGLRLIVAPCITLFALQQDKMILISTVLIIPAAFLCIVLLHGVKFLVAKPELNFNIFIAIKNKIAFRMYMLSFSRWKYFLFFGIITLLSICLALVLRHLDLHLQLLLTGGLIMLLLVFLYILHLYFNFLEDSLGPAHHPDRYVKCQHADLREMVPLDRLISYTHLAMTKRRGGPRYYSFVSSRRFQKGQLISCDYSGDEKNLLVIWVGIPRGPEDRHVTGCIEMYL